MTINLLQNRNLHSPLGAFDGQVAALAQIGVEEYFITTNADYVPVVPSLQLPHALFLREDMRYGTDDPTLWPQQWTERYCHFPAIAEKGTRPDLYMMWWDPAITRGLGRLSHSKLVARVDNLRRTSPHHSMSPLFGQLVQTIQIWSEQLRTLPTKYEKMVFGVSLNWTVVQLHHDLKPRIDNVFGTSLPSSHDADNTPIAECVGAFTSDPAVAQQLWAARLPFWFLRPTFVFDAENILKVVPLQDPIWIPSGAAQSSGRDVIYSGNSTTEKIAAIHRDAVQKPWYHDPFETARSLVPPSTAPPNSAALTAPVVPVVPVAGSSKSAQRSNESRYDSSAAPRTPLAPPSMASVSGRSRSAQRSNESRYDSRYNPYPAKSAAPRTPAPRTKESRNRQSSSTPWTAPLKDPAQPARDKFAVLSISEMPPSISAWAGALARVDRAVPPYTSDPADRRYVLPEPALLVNSTPERRRKFLHHWNLLSDGFVYMLSNPGCTQLLSAQEWRDVLEGLLKTRGHVDSKTHKRSGGLQERIRPALEASGIGSIEGLPVPNESLPHFSLERTREIVWRVAETNFRFEFCALDKWASGKQRMEDVKVCFAGHMLLGVPLEMSKRGWAAPAVDERHPYVRRTARLMQDWVTQSARPPSSPRMQDLENAVCLYYTQAFWEYFGRAAVVPLRLDHVLSAEQNDAEPNHAEHR
ncbi:hypothetical protein B0H10DRAFT_2131673 [Mycena sp. CBHHK59/15]|nr:hypothetical protein B0H10DRAFT_2131673 [Mycena sp. CBHHK59/15]